MSFGQTHPESRTRWNQLVHFTLFKNKLPKKYSCWIKWATKQTTLLPLSCMYLYGGGKSGTMWEFAYDNLVCKTMTFRKIIGIMTFCKWSGVLNLYNGVKENSEFRILDLSLDFENLSCVILQDSVFSCKIWWQCLPNFILMGGLDETVYVKYPALFFKRCVKLLVFILNNCPKLVSNLLIGKLKPFCPH